MVFPVILPIIIKKIVANVLLEDISYLNSNFLPAIGQIQP
jgi:hypothetical protein